MWIATLMVPRKRGRFRYKRLRVVICDFCGQERHKKFDMSHVARIAFEFCGHSCARRHALQTPEKSLAAQRASQPQRTAGIKAAWAKPEVRARMSRGMKAAWADPDTKAARTIAAHSKRRTDPTYGPRLSAAIKKSRAGRTAEFSAIYSDPEVRAKDFETRKRNGSMRESKAELEFVAFLRAHFGEADVVHHPPMLPGYHRHSVDVLVVSLACYVEFDGVFYHGLDRPYADLSPNIRKKYDRDRALDTHCAANGIRLVRVTDVAWKSMTTEDRSAWCASLRQ